MTQEEVLDSQMTLAEHLNDLRKAVARSLLAVIVGFFVAYAFKEDLAAILSIPLVNAWYEQFPNGAAPTLISYSPTGAFWAYFSISLWASVFLSAPVIFYQIWKFVAPGLYKRERKWGAAIAIISALFFLAGALFCYAIVLEPIFNFLLGYSTEDISKGARFVQTHAPISLNYLPDLQEYFQFERKLILGFGIIFELPIAIFFLASMGLVTHRSMWRFNRWWLVCSFIIGAALTPPEIYSQILMAGPLVVLYNLSIGIAYIVTKRRERKEQSV